MTEFENVALKTLVNIDSVTINEDLDEQSVYSFNQRKKKSRDIVKSIINECYAKALALTLKGFSLPETTQEVLWRKGMDWNFEPISSSAGNGYIRWKMRGDRNNSDYLF